MHMADYRDYVSITVKGDARFKASLKTVAAQHGTSIKDLVRLALDTVYGDDLTRAAVFFESSGDKKHHKNGARTAKKAGAR
jgi:hypothetical protein